MPEEPRSTSAFPGPGKVGPRVISIGGGPGGAGKSLLTVNLGIYLAQLGRSVIIADLDPSSAGLHTMLGLDPRRTAPGGSESDEPVTITTSIPGLVLFPAPDPTPAVPSRAPRKNPWLGKLRELAADYVLLDLGGGTSAASLDLFAQADVGVCVTVPEPPAIESTYTFLRVSFVRCVRKALSKDASKLRALERAMKALPSLPTPIEILSELRREDPAVAQIASAQLGRLRPRLVVSQTRVRSDVELGPSMRALSSRYLGIDLDYLGYIEHDDAVWLTVRRKRPLLIDSPTSKGARNLERIARRVLALTGAQGARSEGSELPAPSERLTLYDVLGVSRGASDEEIRRASKRQRDIYTEGSLPLTSLVWGAELAHEQARIEEAHDTLLDPVRRRAYDLSTFPEEILAQAPARRATEGVASELLMLQSELSREIHPETQFTGALLQKVRESQGVEISDIAAKTKIAATHLRAIEKDAFHELPALVYTRGFVQELAKCLRLDPPQVARTYLKRMRESLAASGRGSS